MYNFAEYIEKIRAFPLEELDEKWDDSQSTNNALRADTNERKEIVIMLLLQAWKQVPHLRFGQFLSVAFDGNKDMWPEGRDEYFRKAMFNIEDKDLVKLITKFIEPISMDEALK